MNFKSGEYGNIHIMEKEGAVYIVNPQQLKINKLVYATNSCTLYEDKDDKLSKHQIIEKMWEDDSFKVGNGISHSDHFNKIKPFLDEVFQKFKSVGNV